MQVDPERDVEEADAADQVAHLPGHADADGVRDDDLVGPGRCCAPGELGDAARVDGALERAAEGGADRHGRADPVRLRARDDPLAGGHSLFDRRARVAAVELLRRGEREVDLVEAAVAEPVVAALVERETGIDHPVASVDRCDDLLRPGHLRHVLRADEAHGLDARHTRAREAVDQLGPHLGRERDGLVLQAVTRRDVADGDPHTIPSSRNPSSSDAERPSSPR